MWETKNNSESENVKWILAAIQKIVKILNVVYLLRRIKAAITWLVNNVIMNFVGYVFKNGNYIGHVNLLIPNKMIKDLRKNKNYLKLKMIY